MTTEHTPGPWAIYPETNGSEICAVYHAPGLPIRQMIARPVVGENWIANARLIAAAPDMLEALRRSAEGWANALELGIIPQRHRNTAEILSDACHAAIAQAEGKL